MEVALEERVALDEVGQGTAFGGQFPQTSDFSL